MYKKKIYSIAEAAARLKMSRNATAYAARTGKLKPIFGGLLGNRIVGIAAESVDAVIEYRKTHPQTGRLNPIFGGQLDGDGNATRDTRPAAR